MRTFAFSTQPAQSNPDQSSRQWQIDDIVRTVAKIPGMPGRSAILKFVLNFAISD
jgi:hypothetical protein